MTLSRLVPRRRRKPGTDGASSIIPAPPPKPRPLWARILLLGLPVVVVAATVIYAWPLKGWSDLMCDGLGDDLYQEGGECIGVTDGSYVFDPAFAELQE
ncbi:MAG: hypothetical protein ACRD0P_11610, partial [Stackebrandtia sp.]